MSSEKFSQKSRASSCPQRADCRSSYVIRKTKTAGRNGRYIQRDSFERSGIIVRTEEQRPLVTWHSIAGKKSGFHESNHKGRWATRQAELRIRNMPRSAKESEIEKVEGVLKNDGLHSFQFNERMRKTPNNSGKQTYKQCDQSTHNQTPYKQAKQLKKQYKKKIETLSSVYINDSVKCQRHERLLNKMEDIQISEAKSEYTEAVQKHKERELSRKRQVESLRRIRKKFDDEQTVRFQKQFVSWKSVEKYRYNKSANGLPDVLPKEEGEEDDSEKHQYYLYPIDREKLRSRNKKRYNNILNPSINNRRAFVIANQDKPERDNSTVLDDAHNVLFNTEMDVSLTE